MQIGVFSDIHDNLENLRKALAVFTARGIGVLVFCGDFCSPIPVRVIGAFTGEVHCVFGNGDGDRFTMAKLAQEFFPNLKLHGEHAELTLGGLRIAATHYPLYARALALTGDYAAVFSGHTHEMRQERLGGCLWLNPGEVMGWKGPATCAVYDTEAREAEIVTLG
jgi:uncharacterized protein